MSSLFHSTKLSSYRAIRGASQGASVSLLHGCGEYVATFACAVSIASALGTQATDEAGVPTYRVPLEDVATVCAKLAQRFSVALIEVVCDGTGSRFILLWKIPAVPVADLNPVSLDPNDY